jgi:hypothetical protein
MSNADIAYTGNSVPAPGFVVNGFTNDDELLASANNYYQKGVTLKPGQGVLLLGTFLKQDPATKKYVRATTAAEALGVLRKTTGTGTTADSMGWMGNIVYGGLLKLDRVVAANPGIADVSAYPGAHVDNVQGYFKF